MNKPATVGLLALALALTGCASANTGDNGVADQPTVTVLSKEQLQSALLTGSEVDPTLSVAPSDEVAIDGGPDLGCLESLEKLDTSPAATEAEIEFEDPDGMVWVYNSAASFPSEAEVSAAMAEVRADLAQCTDIAVDEDGTTLSLTVSTDDTKGSPDVDDQISISAVGTMATAGLELPVGFWISYAQVDNNAVSVASFAMSDPGTAEYMRGAVAKLTAVAQGQPIPTISAPTPGADYETYAGTDDLTGESPTILPLETGASVNLPAADDSMMISWDTPVEVAFDNIECAETLPGVGFNDDFENVDFVAGEGDQACLVELAVTNVSKVPNGFGSSNYANLRTTDGYEFSETSQSYDNQGIAASNGREPSFTTDNIQPNKTKYDYVIFEIPADSTAESLVYTITTAS